MKTSTRLLGFLCLFGLIATYSAADDLPKKGKFTEPKNRIVFHLSEKSVSVSYEKDMIKGEQLNELVEWLNNDDVIQILLARRFKDIQADHWGDDEEEFPIQGHRNELPKTSNLSGKRSEGCNCGDLCLCNGNCKCEKGHPVYYNVKNLGLTPRAGGNFKTYQVQCGIED